MPFIPKNKKYLLLIETSKKVRWAADTLRELHNFAVRDSRLDKTNHTYHLCNKTKTRSISFRTDGCSYWELETKK